MENKAAVKERRVFPLSPVSEVAQSCLLLQHQQCKECFTICMLCSVVIAAEANTSQAVSNLTNTTVKDRVGEDFLKRQ